MGCDLNRNVLVVLGQGPADCSLGEGSGCNTYFVRCLVLPLQSTPAPLTSHIFQLLFHRSQFIRSEAEAVC
jgi:hypothetical protein